MLLPGEIATDWGIVNAKELSSSKSQRKLSGNGGGGKMHTLEGEKPTVLENQSLVAAWRIF